MKTAFHLKTLIAASFLAIASVGTQAQNQPELTVYVYDSFTADWGPGPIIKTNFEAECDCKLNFVSTESSIGALRKVQLEGDETKADIVLGLDSNTMAAAQETGLFVEHTIDISGLNLPVDWTDKTFVPFDFGYFAFVYDKRQVENPPSSFEALKAMPDDFKIVIQDPRSSTPGLGLLLWVNDIYGEKAGQFWTDIQPKILTVTKGWSEAYGLFLKGEADMVLSYTTSPAYHLIAEEDPNYASAAFEEGHQIQVEVAGIVKSSDQQDLANEFLAFMLTEGFQSAIPTNQWMYPATALDLPKGYETLHVPEKARLQEPALVEANREAIIDTWLAATNQ